MSQNQLTAFDGGKTLESLCSVFIAKNPSYDPHALAYDELEAFIETPYGPQNPSDIILHLRRDDVTVAELTTVGGVSDEEATMYVVDSKNTDRNTPVGSLLYLTLTAYAMSEEISIRNDQSNSLSSARVWRNLARTGIATCHADFTDAREWEEQYLWLFLPLPPDDVAFLKGSYEIPANLDLDELIQ